MFIFEGSGDWSATVTCRRTWHHYAITDSSSKMTRVVGLQDLYIVFAIELNLLYIHCLLFRLNVVFLDQLEKDDVFVYTWHHDFTKLTYILEMWLWHFFNSGTNIKYTIIRPYLWIVVLNWVLFSFFLMVLSVLLRFTDSDNLCGILKLLFYIHLLLFRLLTHLKDVMCLLTQDVTILRN
jgi:hypothetical protein